MSVFSPESGKSSARLFMRLIAGIFMVLALARAAGLWLADPMLAYANNYDQIRIIRTFGMQPKDAPVALYESTPNRPYRYYEQKDRYHTPMYPSSDIAVKIFMLGGMRIAAFGDDVLDIKIGGAMVLAVWAFFVIYFARALRLHETGLLIFSAWAFLIADPVNFLFLNTWYAEFPAFVSLTILGGILLAWYFRALPRKTMLQVGGAALFMLALNRKQYMFLPLALWLMAFAATALQAHGRAAIRQSARAWGLWLLMALLTVAWMGSSLGQLKMAAQANRTDTIFGALLPASKKPALAMERMGLPASCAQFIGSNWYFTPTEKFNEHCPEVFEVSLPKMGLAVAGEPSIMERIIRHISRHHRAFVQTHLGHIEKADFGKIEGQDTLAAFSADAILQMLPDKAIEILIHLMYLAPVLCGLGLFCAGRRRAAAYFLLLGFAYAYVLFSSIFGDGYMEVERHAVLSFSIGALMVASFALLPLQIILKRRE